MTRKEIKQRIKDFTEREKDRIIEQAWEDRSPFDAIYEQFHLPEKGVIELMRRNMKPSSFRMWRARVQDRPTKHLRGSKVTNRFKSSRQKHISGNKIT